MKHLSMMPAEMIETRVYGRTKEEDATHGVAIKNGRDEIRVNVTAMLSLV